MAIHENLTRVPKQQLREIGWTKARELAKVARREGERFESAPWVHKAQALPREEFKREVERHLTGKETEPWEIIYFKLYKSQLPVVEKALETAGLMLGPRLGERQQVHTRTTQESIISILTCPGVIFPTSVCFP